MRKDLIAPLVLALIFLVGSANAECVSDTTGKDFGCGDTVTESCTFNENLSCPSGHGLEIGEDGITIDGNGHKITGGRNDCSGCDGETNQIGCSCGILSENHDNVTIKNLEVTNFCNGIVIRGEQPHHAQNILIENGEVHDNGAEGSCDDGAGYTHGIHLLLVDDSVITTSNVHNNTGCDTDACLAGGMGIVLSTRCNNNSIINNSVHDNAHSGIYSKMICKYNNVSYNEIINNGKYNALAPCGGVVGRCKLSSEWKIEQNEITDNYGPGIFMGGEKNIITYNTITGSKNKAGGDIKIGYGISMGRSDGSFNNELYHNIVCDNEGESIYSVTVEAGRENTGDENRCDSTINYDDEGTTGCTYSCGGPIADFVANQTKGYAPMIVAFTDRSKPNEDVESWLWDFGDGETSDEQNPIHTYETAVPYSYYNVSLTVNWTGDETANKTKAEYIKVWKTEAAPNADFICSKGVGDTTKPVTFTDESIGEVYADSWKWYFGDGDTSTEQNPGHYYDEEGIYTVSLTVAGPGSTSKETKFNCTRVGTGVGTEKWPLIDAHFFANVTSGAVPFTVNFTDMSRSEGTINSWNWNFGDGGTNTDQNPAHTYESAGSYNVSLEVTNAGGAKTKETKFDYITGSQEGTIFDTGPGAYPSVMGVHNGTITPDEDIVVNRMYTYSCMGTGGHTECVKIWNGSWDGVKARWTGYSSDYHNIRFDSTFTLFANQEYNYTIRTGSYPQIIHASKHKANAGGNITCRKFTDANGRSYNNWIPAIILWKE